MIRICFGIQWRQLDLFFYYFLLGVVMDIEKLEEIIGELQLLVYQSIGDNYMYVRGSTVEDMQFLIDGAKEIMAENARLQSVIDAANAQPAFGHVIKEKGSLCEFVTTNNVLVGCYPVYARPIPAQQSPAVAAPDGYQIVRHGADQPMCMWACIQHLIRAADILLNQKNYDGTGHEILSEAKSSAERYLKELLVRQPDLSPRITEQDAREIIENYLGGKPQTSEHDEISYWLDNENGRALLDKLNNSCAHKWVSACNEVVKSG